MEKFSEYIIIKVKLLKIFFAMFITCMVIGSIFLYSAYEHYSQVIALVVLSAIIGFVPVSFIGMFRSAQTFFNKANELEAFIRDDGDKDIAIEMLYTLKKDSFHRETGNRLREIAKMMEIKYDVIILKR